MTRSLISRRSPEVVNKALRAQAKQQGITFKAAAEARTKALSEQKIYPLPKNSPRRHNGRFEGTYWNSTTFTCTRKIHGMIVGDYVEDEDEDSVCPDCEQACDAYKLRGGDGNPPRDVVLGSLLDIAKPAKAKGVAKDFEVVARLPRVIVLPDDEYLDPWDYWSDDEIESFFDDDIDWEEVYVNDGLDVTARESQSYAAVLKGKDYRYFDGS